MGRKVARGSRGKSVIVAGGGEERNRPSRGRSRGSPATPSRKREASKARGAAAPRITSGVRERENPFMPGLRVRSDGWTAARTRVFLATLGRTGCISDAARVAGVSTTSVNRSRALFPPFDTACGEAIARALRGLEAVAYERAVEGREMLVLSGSRPDASGVRRCRARQGGPGCACRCACVRHPRAPSRRAPRPRHRDRVRAW